jgi:Cys-tRNA(Pro)/Cys-tRNA(Cys) deacylase
MSTPAIRFLNQRGALFEVVRYAHRRKGAGFAALATGFALERTLKTLVMDLREGGFGLVLAPGDRQVDFKLVARGFSVKKAAMAGAAAAERLTGYHAGGISPFGTRQPLTVLMEEAILAHDRVLVNAGLRGLMLLMSPADIRAALDCRVGRVSEG